MFLSSFNLLYCFKNKTTQSKNMAPLPADFLGRHVALWMWMKENSAAGKVKKQSERVGKAANSAVTILS